MTEAVSTPTTGAGETAGSGAARSAFRLWDDLETAVMNAENVHALLLGLAASECSIQPHGLYPAADVLGKAIAMAKAASEALDPRTSIQS